MNKLAPIRYSSMTLALTFGLSTLAPRLAEAQTPEELTKSRSTRAEEPTAAETITAALEYFRVDPERFDSLRAKARARAFLPIVAGGYRYDGDKYVRREEQAPTPQTNDESTSRALNAYSVGAVWDLRDLVFSAGELQVYGIVGVQRDVMLEVTRTYYLRQQLLLRRDLEPPEDAMARRSLDLRIEELTSTLDVMTGGWFSTSAARRAGARPSP